MFELFFLRNCANIKAYLYTYRRLFYHRKDARTSFKIIFKSIFLRLLFFSLGIGCLIVVFDVSFVEISSSGNEKFRKAEFSFGRRDLKGGHWYRRKAWKVAFDDNVIILSREKRSATTRQTRILMGGGDAWKDYGYPVYRWKGRRLDHNYQRIDEVKGWRYEWRRWIVIEMFPLWLIICLSVAG